MTWRSLVCFFALWHSLTLRAVILHSTGDPEANTTPPPEEQGRRGWELQGTWGGFLGTPVAPSFFITAKHVGGKVGDVFRFRGAEYPATAFFDDSGSDLRIWRVCGQFPDFASLYSRSDELGREFVLFGRGTRRGDAVEVNGALKGWRWGAGDGRMRWGQNRVEGLAAASELGFNAPLSIGPAFLKAVFDAHGLRHEAHLSTGDSAGGLFMQDDGEWKLAGILYAVEGPFNTEASGDGFFGAIFDKRELYERIDKQWVFNPWRPLGPVASAFFASRISSRLDWIAQVIASVDEDESVVVLQTAAEAGGPFADDPQARLDLTARVIRLPIAMNMRFLRLRSCRSITISNAAVDGSELVIRFRF